MPLPCALPSFPNAHTGVEKGAGGETALPLAEPLDEGRQSVRGPAGRGLSECATKQGIAVVPEKVRWVRVLGLGLGGLGLR